MISLFNSSHYLLLFTSFTSIYLVIYFYLPRNLPRSFFEIWKSPSFHSGYFKTSNMRLLVLIDWLTLCGRKWLKWFKYQRMDHMLYVINNFVNHMAKLNFSDVANSVILKFLAVWKFPADDLQLRTAVFSF